MPDVRQGAHRGGMTLRISPWAVRRALVPMVLALAVASVVAQILAYPLDSRGYGFVPLFDAGAERNPPTFYSSLALLACAALLCLGAVRARAAAERTARHWTVLAVVFFLGALDEIVQLHERTNEEIASAVGAGEEARLWVVAAAVLALALLVQYREFVRDLSERARRSAILGGALLVGGALGLELVEAAIHALKGQTGLAEGLVSTLQELFEMLGAVFILEALVLHLSTDRDRRGAIMPAP